MEFKSSVNTARRSLAYEVDKSTFETANSLKKNTSFEIVFL